MCVTEHPSLVGETCATELQQQAISNFHAEHILLPEGAGGWGVTG